MHRASAAPPSAGEVFRLIHDGIATTRTQLGDRTGLSRTAVAARLAALVRAGLVVESSPGPSTGGRPPVRLRLNAEGGAVLVAAIGRSRTQLAVCDLAGEPLLERNIDREVDLGPDRLMPMIAAELGELLVESGRPADSVRGIGLSIPGYVDLDRGASLGSPLMSGWDAVPLGPYLDPFGPVPVYLDNDTNVMALSEWRGHLRTYSDVVLVKASTGVGAGLVAGGVLLRGGRGAAGEIGHTRVADGPGVHCHCGQLDCLESLASGRALVQRLRASGRAVTHVREVVALARSGDTEAVRMIREAGRRIGEVIATSVNLLNPQALVIGGDMALAYEPLVAGLREAVYARSTALATRDLQILPATWGDRSGVIGCSAMVLADVLSPTEVDAALAHS